MIIRLEVLLSWKILLLLLEHLIKINILLMFYKNLLYIYKKKSFILSSWNEGEYRG